MFHSPNRSIQNGKIPIPLRTTIYSRRASPSPGNGKTISGLCVRRVKTETLTQTKDAQGAALISFGKGTTVKDLTIHTITIRDQKSRWGSCSSRGTLSFNYKLVFAPPKVLDYVVVHELCHLKHLNHSKAFWGEVARYLPDYKDRKKKLI